MSVIAATTLREKTSALDVPVETLRQGALKAWVVINQGGAQSILDSFNIASTTDPGTGGTTMNFTNLMGSANYGMVGCASGSTTIGWVTTRTTAALSLFGYLSSTAAGNDSSYFTGGVYGDHA